MRWFQSSGGGPAESIVFQGLILAGERGIFIPTQHAAHEFEEAQELLVGPDFFLLFSEPRTARQIETKAQHLAVQ